MDSLEKARNIKVAGPKQKKLWEEFKRTITGSDKAEKVLAKILSKHTRVHKDNRNEIFLVACNAVPKGIVHEKAHRMLGSLTGEEHTKKKKKAA